MELYHFSKNKIQPMKSDNNGTKGKTMNQPDIFEKVKELNQNGESFFQDGEMEQAKEQFSAAIDMDPDDCRALNNLGVFYWFSGDVQEALESLTKAYEINPYHRQVIQNLLEILTELNQTEEAELIGKTYMERYPEDDEMAELLDAKSNSEES